MFPQKFKYRIGLFYKYHAVILKLLILDQLSKWWFIGRLKIRKGLAIEAWEYLDFVYVWNYGISFGFFRNYYQYSNIFFGSLNLCIVIYISYLLYNEKYKPSKIAYILILGGAWGNLFDRWFRGAVFDFIRIHYEDFSFPIFNLADFFISCGVIFLLYSYYAPRKKEYEEDFAEESAEEEEYEYIEEEYEEYEEYDREGKDKNKKS